MIGRYKFLLLVAPHIAEIETFPAVLEGQVPSA